MSNLEGKKRGLFILAAAPLIWTVHLLLSYSTAAIWCEKVAGPGGAIGTVRVAILVYTVLALIGIGFTGGLGWRMHNYGTATLPHNADTAGDRTRFLGFATLLLSGLSAVAVIYAAFVVIFVQRCT